MVRPVGFEPTRPVKDNGLSSHYVCQFRQERINQATGINGQGGRARTGVVLLPRQVVVCLTHTLMKSKWNA